MATARPRDRAIATWLKSDCVELEVDPDMPEAAGVAVSNHAAARVDEIQDAAVAAIKARASPAAIAELDELIADSNGRLGGSLVRETPAVR